ncbi:MAG: Dam family site-specific DNA-(adenine-N6)-methyltransferase [Gammaproteobacteria bacterium]|nr:Dam family site-specific DNA-(adenine-N6)-methyltransferase [Gammaproteobacteria bacterium]
MTSTSKRHNIKNETDNIRPFLKWAGNKYRIIEHIRKSLPEGKRLVEPFAGSAAVFLNTNYEEYLVSDSNPDLIHLFTLLKTDGVDFIKKCRRYFTSRYNNEEEYYRLREKFNKTTDIRQRAVLFIYLNRHGYNGLCRYNNKGGYNVPFGRYKKPYFPEKEMLFFHEKAQKATFVTADYDEVIQSAKSGDVVYCDPPYVPLSASANFTTYSSGGFNMENQQRLADLAETTASKGIPVLISNHNTSFTRKAYNKANKIKKFYVQRYISCNGSKRESAGELLALFN